MVSIAKIATKVFQSCRHTVQTGEAGNSCLTFFVVLIIAEPLNVRRRQALHAALPADNSVDGVDCFAYHLTNDNVGHFAVRRDAGV
ncbi:hypothetical protein LJR289_002001 [Pseudoduganella sp. LjRoot289]|uniref:hypothetical protein n=1 Tax=Pseudoduganella sp. LjRoot289 TaxID=3342314 RepID=UPI003ED10A91